MKTTSSCQSIIEALEGSSPSLQKAPAERRDWSGPALVLDLFEKTSGTERIAFIAAMGEIIEQHRVSPAAVADLINIASSLGLAEIEPQVRALRAEPFAAQEPVQRALTNFLGLRSLAFVKPAPASASTHAPMPRANGTVSKRNAAKGRKAPS